VLLFGTFDEVLRNVTRSYFVEVFGMLGYLLRFSVCYESFNRYVWGSVWLWWVLKI
jgi:hypothetical protein